MSVFTKPVLDDVLCMYLPMAAVLTCVDGLSKECLCCLKYPELRTILSCFVATIKKQTRVVTLEKRGSEYSVELRLIRYVNRRRRDLLKILIFCFAMKKRIQNS